jgi:hypothetical protein
MNRSTTAWIGGALVVAATLAGCAASTQMTNSWVDPTAVGRPHQKIVVVGVTAQSAARRSYEEGFVNALATRGITGVPSYTLGTGDGKMEQAAIEAKLKETGADAVIVTRMVDEQTVQNYYPGTTYAAPSAYYGGWYGYYSMGYSYMYDPGYVTTDKVYRLETNLYDVADAKLLWSGLTETTIPAGDSPTTEIQPLIVTIVADMEKKGVLPKAPKK